jgi:hypothetical protein
MAQCNKCYTELNECEDCNGQTNSSLGGWSLTCSSCNSTGQVCPTHGRFWD